MSRDVAYELRGVVVAELIAVTEVERGARRRFERLVVERFDFAPGVDALLLVSIALSAPHLVVTLVACVLTAIATAAAAVATVVE